jgi:type I protein arginine methyltransferase
MSDALSEHIEYLILPGRNALYRQAIVGTVKPGDMIADLGCGVGVLGLFCLEAGADRVWGIDSSHAIHLARAVMDMAGLADRYVCIGESTFRTSLPEQVDLIICDHVGFFGFDYGIIALMRDARRRFMKPGGTMIPQSLDLVVAGVMSDDCRAKAEAWSLEIVPEPYRSLEALARNVRYSHCYRPEHLIAPPVPLGHIDFADDDTEFYRFEATLTAMRDGRFDGIAGWFDCHLAGDVRMTNDPLAPDSIQRSQAFLPAQESFSVEAGDEIAITIRFRADDTMISWTIQPPHGAPRQQMSTFNSTVLSPADLVKQPDRALALSSEGKARAFVLAQVDGERTGAAITAKVLAEWPDMLPTEQAIRDFVTSVLAHHCAL